MNSWAKAFSIPMNVPSAEPDEVERDPVLWDRATKYADKLCRGCEGYDMTRNRRYATLVRWEKEKAQQSPVG